MNVLNPPAFIPGDGYRTSQDVVVAQVSQMFGIPGAPQVLRNVRPISVLLNLGLTLHLIGPPRNLEALRADTAGYARACYGTRLDAKHLNAQDLSDWGQRIEQWVEDVDWALKEGKRLTVEWREPVFSDIRTHTENGNVVMFASETFGTSLALRVDAELSVDTYYYNQYDRPGDKLVVNVPHVPFLKDWETWGGLCVVSRSTS